MSNAKRMVGDREPQAAPKPKKAVDACNANDCPLPGTIRPENGEPVCGVHFLANKAGWPKATSVLLNHLALHDMSKKAQNAGTPMSMSSESAALLMDAAKAHGLKFGEPERETYRRAAMKLTVAGVLVEQAISAAAVHAAMTHHVSTSEYLHEQEHDSFDNRLRGLMNNMRMGA
jgi:hypothetical protein